MADPRREIPSVNSANFAQRMRETIMVYLGKQGNKLDRGVTVRDLVEGGYLKLRQSWLGGDNNPFDGVAPGFEVPKDTRPPPTPSGFAADGALSHILVTCDDPTYQSGHGHGESVLYGAPFDGTGPMPTFANAVELARFPGTVYAYGVNPSTRLRLWLKWRSKDGVLSLQPAGGINGLDVSTGLDVAPLLDALTAAAEDPSAPYAKFAVRADLFYVSSSTGPTDAGLFSVVTVPITMNGVTVPVGVYMRDAFIMNGTIVNAKIGNAAIDNAKIANVSASKLTAGSITVGEYIQSIGYASGLSGWRIDGNGNLEANNATIRGTTYVGGGTVGGIIIEPTAIRSSNYNGTSLGFRLGADGTLDMPNGVVLTRNLAAGAVTADKISVQRLDAMSATMGTLAAGQLEIDGGPDPDSWGYVRTPGKWLDDNDGWILARNRADGANFLSFKCGGMRFNMHNYPGGYGAAMDWGGIYMDSSGYLEVRRQAVIDTLNVAAGAVAAHMRTSGTSDTITIGVTVPEGQTWDVVANGYVAPYYVNDTNPAAGYDPAVYVTLSQSMFSEYVPGVNQSYSVDVGEGTTLYYMKYRAPLNVMGRTTLAAGYHSVSLTVTGPSGPMNKILLLSILKRP
ncbi:hypothetical protein ABIC63_002132 [Pseudacidovorax sp. 1753]|uniref:phage tail tip fiber protein n=1 Tax=Pseudacidovorax sp. 1753 TaxID=3156419 RepID=UPI003393D649